MTPDSQNTDSAEPGARHPDQARLNQTLPPDLKPSLAQTLMLLGLWKACEHEYLRAEETGNVQTTLRPEAAERRVHSAVKVLLPPEEVDALITPGLRPELSEVLIRTHAYLQAAREEHLAQERYDGQIKQELRNTERRNALLNAHVKAEQRTLSTLEQLNLSEQLMDAAWELHPELWNQEVAALLEELHETLPLISRRPGMERRLRREHLAAQLTVRAEWDWLQGVRAARGEPIIRPEIRCVATGLLPKTHREGKPRGGQKSGPLG